MVFMYITLPVAWISAIGTWIYMDAYHSTPIDVVRLDLFSPEHSGP